MIPALARIALNVGDLGAAIGFYAQALNFTLVQEEAADPALARLLGVATARSARLRRGGQMLELCACGPRGAPMPLGGRSNDGWFQHCALVSSDIAADVAHLRNFAITPISRQGPQMLPGGITAFKFRDPEGHPLELIAFPRPDPATAGGIDHSAICVADVARSIAFYAGAAELCVRARQINRGPAQDALDDLDEAVVDVVALASRAAGPHVELLHYRQPQGRAAACRPNDICATRLVFARPGHAGFSLRQDPDGHAVLFEDCP